MIECPFCLADWDPSDYPDHKAGDSFECDPDLRPENHRQGCGKTFWITAIDWDPVYYTGKEPPHGH